MAGASIETTLELWASSLRDVKARMRPLFTQERVAANAGLFLDGLLGTERRKTGWMRAEAAGDPGPWRQQAVLGRGRWDADALRDIVRAYVVEHLADDDAVADRFDAGHATRIEIELAVGDWLTIRDNGRGIPIDPHPRFPDKSALEVILTTLHAGGKFGGEAYRTSGGLHGVGVSVVNALSDALEVEVARDRRLWRQSYSRGVPKSALQDCGAVQNRRGTMLRFHPDREIFGKAIGDFQGIDSFKAFSYSSIVNCNGRSIYRVLP